MGLGWDKKSGHTVIYQAIFETLQLQYTGIISQIPKYIGAHTVYERFKPIDSYVDGSVFPIKEFDVDSKIDFRTCDVLDIGRKPLISGRTSVRKQIVPGQTLTNPDSDSNRNQHQDFPHFKN